LIRAIALALVAGCGAPASWSAPVTGLDRIVLSAWGPSPREVWFVGGGLGGGAPALALRFDGDAFVDMKPPTPNTLWWVHGVSGSEVWLVGDKGTILRWSGAGFETVTSGTDRTLYGVWAAARDDAWTVGGDPNAQSVLLHWDGKAWAPAAGAPQLGGALFKVWGGARDDVWAVGDGGTILHYNGSTWTKMESGLPARVTLFTVAGRGRDDVYAVGGLGSPAALRWDGKAWAPVAGLNLDFVSGLSGVAVAPSGDVVITGIAGAKFRGRPGAWIDDSRLEPRQDDFHGALAFGPEDLWIVGGNFTAPRGAARTGVIAHYGQPVPTARR
jgi:hypothetical protein